MQPLRISGIFFFIYMATIPISIARLDAPARAAVHCVSTAVDFQEALTAAGNGEDDEIHVVQGLYSGNFTVSTSETNRLDIESGYTGPDCASRTVNAFNTVFNGAAGGSVLDVEISVAADFEMGGVTLENGRAPTGGGLAISTLGNVNLLNNRFSENEATDSGGGLHVSKHISTANTGGATPSGNDLHLRNDDDGNGSASTVILVNNDLNQAPLERSFHCRLPSTRAT